MKKILGIISVLIVGLSLTGCGSKTINNWDGIEDRGYFIVGLDDTFAPMGFRNNSGELVGFDVDLATEVSNRLGVEVRFQTIDWDSKVLELNSGTIDMIWNGLTITESRLEEMSFSMPYLENTQMIMTSKGSLIDTVDDLSGKKVGVQIGSASEDAVKADPVYSDLDELVKYDTFTQALLDLQNGTIDAVVIDEIMGRYVISQSNDIYDVALENFGEEQYGIGFRLESTEIRDQINDIIANMIEDGTASSISIKWFDEDIFFRQ